MTVRIINRTNGRETSLSGAVSIVTDGDENELRALVVRLLEELTSDALGGPPVLRDAQLARILAYKFKVEEI